MESSKFKSHRPIEDFFFEGQPPVCLRLLSSTDVTVDEGPEVETRGRMYHAWHICCMVIAGQPLNNGTIVSQIFLQIFKFNRNLRVWCVVSTI